MLRSSIRKPPAGPWTRNSCSTISSEAYDPESTGTGVRRVPALPARWPDEPEDGTPSAEELIRTHGVDLVVNIPKDFSRPELGNGYRVRRTAVDFNVPLVTDARLAAAYIRAFCTLPESALEVVNWGEYAEKW